MLEEKFVSLDDDQVVPASQPVFKGQQDHFYRIHFPDPNKIMVYRQHFEDNAKFIRCLKDKDEPCPACEQVSESTMKFKANIIVYSTTTEDGTPPEDLNYVSLSPQVFRFGIKIWNLLRTKHKKFAKQGGLASIDLILKCTNGQYQHFDIEDDANCLVNVDERLKGMFEKAKTKFTDFSNDLDLKFPTPAQFKVWMEKATGKVQSIQEEVQDQDLSDDGMVDSAFPQANIDDLM